LIHIQSLTKETTKLVKTEAIEELLQNIIFTLDNDHSDEPNISHLIDLLHLSSPLEIQVDLKSLHKRISHMAKEKTILPRDIFKLIEI
jgi:hypothetical protein